MKRVCFIAPLLAALALSGCGQKTTPPVKEPAPQPEAQMPAAEQTAPVQSAGDRNPTAAELGREETTELVFSLEGEAEVISATLYVGQGYSIYIPDQGWRLEKDVDDGIPEETWESTVNDDVELTVSHYAGKTFTEARGAFARDCGYVFKDLMGGELGDPLTGMDDDGHRLSFMAAEGADTIYVISWEYPAEAAEGFGARLAQIAGTFEVMA